MANIKISELEELTTVADDDVLPIVDVSENETKKINKSNIIDGLIKENTDALLTNVVSRNIYKPELKSNWIKSNCSVSLNYDEYTFVSTGTDMYLGNVTAEDSTYNEDRGKLIEVIGGKTLTIVPSNNTFNAIYVTAYDSNKKSLGYVRLTSSKYQIPNNAKFIVIRFGVNPATSGTIYKTKLLVTYAEETTYTPYLNLQELQENNNIINYSTNEHIIGTWIDDKPIYRKVIKISNIKLENGIQIPTNIVNIKELIKYEAIFNLGIDKYNNFIFNQNSGTILTSKLSGSNIIIVTNDYYLGSNNRIYTFIIEYTKTTD